MKTKKIDFQHTGTKRNTKESQSLRHTHTQKFPNREHMKEEMKDIGKDKYACKYKWILNV